MDFVVSLGLILFGIINLSASVDTINSVGGWRSPDIGYVFDICVVFVVVGVALITIGLITLTLMDVLRVSLSLMCVTGPAFSMFLLVLLHVKGGED